MASSVIESANQNFKDLDRLRKEQEAALQKISLAHQKISQAHQKIVQALSEQKRKRMKADVDPTRLSSPAVSLRAPPEHSNVLVGDQVAARVTTDIGDKDQWIVVKVIRFDREANKYEVIDEDPGDDEETGQRKYKLPPSYIIPFPKRVDPSSAPDFSTGSQVLAVYPGTTTLYKATIVGSHRKMALKIEGKVC